MRQEAYIILYTLRHTDGIFTYHYCVSNGLSDMHDFIEELKEGNMLEEHIVYKVEEVMHL